MKKTILLASTLVTMTLYSQVGINTQNPKATLDVVGYPTDLSKTDGIIVPRISGNDLKAKDTLYSADQTGTIIYVTSAALPSTTKTAEVTSAGFYYFNGNVWKSIGSAGVDMNIYNQSGTVTAGANRTVTIPDATNVNFNGVAGGSFYAWTDNGTIGFFGYEDLGRIQLYTNGANANIEMGTNGTNSNILLQSDTLDKNVGIGTGTPTAKLHTNGTVRHQTLPTNDTNTLFMTTDANGNVATRQANTILPGILVGGNGTDATPTAYTISSSGSATEQILLNRSFTLTKRSVVTFSYSVGMYDVLRSNGSQLTDGVSKQLGARLSWSALPGGSPFSVGNTISRSAIPFTNTGSNYVSGTFFLNGSRTIILDPGTYGINMIGYVYAFDNVQGVRATFDGGVDQLDIVAVPLQ